MKKWKETAKSLKDRVVGKTKEKLGTVTIAGVNLTREQLAKIPKEWFNTDNMQKLKSQILSFLKSEKQKPVTEKDKPLTPKDYLRGNPNGARWCKKEEPENVGAEPVKEDPNPAVVAVAEVINVDNVSEGEKVKHIQDLQELYEDDNITILSAKEDLEQRTSLMARQLNNLKMRNKEEKYARARGLLGRVKSSLSRLKDTTLSRSREYSLKEKIKKEILEKHGHLGLNIDPAKEQISLVTDNHVLEAELMNGLNAVRNVKRIKDEGGEVELKLLEGEKLQELQSVFVESVVEYYKGLKSEKDLSTIQSEINKKIQKDLQKILGKKDVFRSDLIYKIGALAAKGLNQEDGENAVRELAQKQAKKIKVEVGSEVLDRQAEVTSSVNKVLHRFGGDFSPLVGSALLAGVGISSFVAQKGLTRAAGMIGASSLASGLFSGLRELKTQRDNQKAVLSQLAMDSSIALDSHGSGKLYLQELVTNNVAVELKDLLQKIDKMGEGKAKHADALNILKEIIARQNIAKESGFDLILESGLGNSTKQYELAMAVKKLKEVFLAGNGRNEAEINQAVQTREQELRQEVEKIQKKMKNIGNKEAVQAGTKAFAYSALGGAALTGLSAGMEAVAPMVKPALENLRENLARGIKMPNIEYFGLNLSPYLQNSEVENDVVNPAVNISENVAVAAEQVQKIEKISQTVSRENIERFLAKHFDYKFENPNRFFHDNNTLRFDGKELQMHVSGTKVDVSDMVKNFSPRNFDGSIDCSFDSIKSNFANGQICGGKLIFNLDLDAKNSAIVVPVNSDGTVNVTGPLAEILKNRQFKTMEFAVQSGDGFDHVLSTVKGKGFPANFEVKIPQIVNVDQNISNNIPPVSPNPQTPVMVPNITPVETTPNCSVIPPINFDLENIDAIPAFAFANGKTPVTFTQKERKLMDLKNRGKTTNPKTDPEKKVVSPIDQKFEPTQEQKKAIDLINTLWGSLENVPEDVRQDILVFLSDPKKFDEFTLLLQQNRDVIDGVLNGINEEHVRTKTEYELIKYILIYSARNKVFELSSDYFKKKIKDWEKENLPQGNNDTQQPSVTTNPEDSASSKSPSKPEKEKETNSDTQKSVDAPVNGSQDQKPENAGKPAETPEAQGAKPEKQTTPTETPKVGLENKQDSEPKKDESEDPKEIKKNRHSRKKYACRE